MYCLNLDILGELLNPYYSTTGRPATLQPEIFRSFSLMFFQKETSITKWVKKLHSDAILAACIGCTIDYSTLLIESTIVALNNCLPEIIDDIVVTIIVIVLIISIITIGKVHVEFLDIIYIK